LHSYFLTLAAATLPIQIKEINHLKTALELLDDGIVIETIGERQMQVD